MSPKILITVDTEALPARAEHSHVNRLIWGRHDEGTAGIEQIAQLSNEVGVPFLFFLDMAGALTEPDAYRDVARFLIRSGQDVQLHFHPEILGKSFWRRSGTELETLRQDLFTYQQSRATLAIATEAFQRICDYPPSAYRAGSFRWNRGTLEAMRELGIQYSFNCCRETSIKENFETYSSPSGKLFRWSNGIIEVPCGEAYFRGELVHLRFPRSLPRGLNFADMVRNIATEYQENDVIIILLHSWSFLTRHSVTGHYYYENNRKYNNFLKFLRTISKFLPIIGLSDLHNLSESHTLEERNTNIVPYPE